MKLEIEVKAKVKDFEPIKNKLKELGCVFSLPINQDDYIYNKKGIDIYKGYDGSPILRVRVQKDKILFTLKKNRSNELDCIEKELEINDKGIMEDIFELLDYKKTVEVHKKRVKTNYKDYEICLDEVNDLGSYIEVEKMSEEDGETVQNELSNFLQMLGVSKEDRVFQGYDTLIYFKNNPN